MGPMDQVLGPKSRVGVPGPTRACSCLLIVHLTPQDTSILAGTLLIFHFLTLSLSSSLRYGRVSNHNETRRFSTPSKFSRQISQSGNLQLSIFFSLISHFLCLVSKKMEETEGCFSSKPFST